MRYPAIWGFRFSLILACALQLQVFAGENSDGPDLLSPSSNQKSKIENRKSKITSQAQAGENLKPALPPASEILARVRAILPRETLLIKGQILSGGRIGKLERVCYLDTHLDFRADPAIVRYKISDLFGVHVPEILVQGGPHGRGSFGL